MVEPELLQITLQYDADELQLYMQGYMHARASTRPPSRAHTRTRTPTHTQICNIYCFSISTIIRECASVLLQGG